MTDPARPELVEEPAEPGERGRTVVAARAVEKIAARAATEVPAIGGVTRRVLGVGLPTEGSATRPRVRAEVDGDLATLRMWVSIAYPQPIGTVVGHTRRLVADRVARLAGLEIDHLDVVVTALVPEPAARRVR